MKTKILHHTPGPWSHRNGRIFSTDQPNLTIANVARSVDGDYSPANGDLLAASTELLKVTKQLLEFALNVHAGKSQRIIYAVMDEARAAIAKAEGGE